MDVLSNAYRHKLIQTMLTDASLLRDARRFIDPNDFVEGPERNLVSFCLYFYDQHGCAPDQFVVVDSCKELGLDEDEASALMAEYAQSTDQASFIKQKLIDFARNRKLMRSLEKASSMLGHEGWDDIMSVIREAESYGDLNPPSALILPNLDISPDDSTLDLPKVPTGISSIDETMGGGLPLGHIGCVVAPPNHGKSTFLIALGAHALRMKMNVVHFTLEMSKEQTAVRYNQACGFALMKKGPRRVNKLGQLAIIESMSKKKISELAAMLRTIPFSPGLIIVDYAALAKPTKDFKEFRHVLAEIFRELRSFAQEQRVPVWTAHQATRNAMSDGYRKESTITMAHLSESFEIAAIVDVLLTLNATDNEKNQGVCRIYTAKNRLGPANATTTVYCDYSKCLVTDQCVED